jgi:hypothetical protein
MTRSSDDTHARPYGRSAACRVYGASPMLASRVIFSTTIYCGVHRRATNTHAGHDGDEGPTIADIRAEARGRTGRVDGVPRLRNRRCNAEGHSTPELFVGRPLGFIIQHSGKLSLLLLPLIMSARISCPSKSDSNWVTGSKTKAHTGIIRRTSRMDRIETHRRKASVLVFGVHSP